MKWSWKIARVAGIEVFVHATFLLLVGWVALSYWLVEQSVRVAATGVAFILALFGCVVLHEFGHALMARRFGIRTRDITLLPIGGLARLERMPDEPVRELWVAIAGPAVNVVIAAFLYLWLALSGDGPPTAPASVTDGSLLERLMFVNLGLVAFNLLPAFPMDGGRVLRALLATRLEYTRATQIAASIGQLMAFGFGFVGLLGNPVLLFVAFFVWIGAAEEASVVQMRSALAGIPVSRAMVTQFRTVTPRDTVADVVEQLLTTAQKDFPVVQDHHVIGIVLHTDLPSALRRSEGTPVAEFMRDEFHTVDSHDMLDAAFRRLQACQCHTMPVLHHRQLVGLLTMDNVGEYLSIHALRETHRAA
jgi:Zn-dependent protease/CBS domain-containing protein